MRVIAGSLGGRRLVAPRDRSTRPTADRVKEALFSILGDAVTDAVVLDLYAGSGALGIEALSRGAARACFVESAHDAEDAIRRNLAACGLGARARVIRSTVERARHALAPDAPFGLVFADPPYAHAAAAIAAVAALARELAPSATVVLEHARRDELSATFGRAGLEPFDERGYGDTGITLLRVGAEV
ncbi:MAG: 16S rRNA (guanine(966)-N(2))-methyltransferase RsmD [Polyangiaceae bacterium]